MQHASDIDKGIEAGLADVIACTSSISLVDGASGRLLYRGYDIAELAEQSSFEEVAYLLWFGRLPGVVEFRAFLDGFSGSMKMPVETVMILRMFPHAATPMEVLRTAVSSLGHWDPDSGNTRLDACLRKAQRITERIPLIIAAHRRLRDGHEPLKPKAGHSIAFNFLYTLQGTEPHPDMVKAMDTALILHADHELNASTFAARVTAATMTDIYSAMTSAIAALKGPLHGGANAEVMKMLEQIGTPDEVYSNPASPFVYQFLGNVNVFHSRLHGQWADVGRDATNGKPVGDAVAFVRPHDIEIEPTPVIGGFEALVQNVHAIGPLVRVELAHESELVEVELTRERASTLVLGKGQRVWLKPRQVKVFSAGALEDGGSGI